MKEGCCGKYQIIRGQSVWNPGRSAWWNGIVGPVVQSTEISICKLDRLRKS